MSIPSDDRNRVTLRQEGTSAVRFKTWDYDNPYKKHSVRFWNLESVNANVIAAINGVAPQILTTDGFRPSTPQFHERSPANDRWILTIREDIGGQANQALLGQGDKIEDIVITFDVTYFTP
ncbi:MAG: hypothetical protein BWK80_57155 [Desulfobacteraceae bacterium IS3]|nr:MAG: hypothetical protein BWK80_57155 [Desulfobacteraceae bacterium IS3]